MVVASRRNALGLPSDALRTDDGPAMTARPIRLLLVGRRERASDKKPGIDYRVLWIDAQ
jgi:hypothetical protein